MNETITAAIAGIAVLFASILFSIIAYIFKTSIVKRFDDFGEKIDGIMEEIGGLKIELVSDYVKKNELERVTDRRKEMWLELNSLKERIVVIETEINFKLKK